LFQLPDKPHQHDDQVSDEIGYHHLMKRGSWSFVDDWEKKRKIK
jgi:hypothetical protein